MEDSSYEALYMGAYIFVFVIAITITIYLFSSISELSEKAYEYGRAKVDLAVSENVPIENAVILSGSEVISYYFNYIKKDLYSNKPTKNYYTVTIQTKTELLKEGSAYSYEQVKNLIGLSNKYTLKYESKNESTKLANVTLKVII
jgi:hypothetical protein